MCKGLQASHNKFLIVAKTWGRSYKYNFGRYLMQR